MLTTVIIYQQKWHVLFIKDFIMPVAHREIQIGISAFLNGALVFSNF